MGICDFNTGWLFGGIYTEGAAGPGYDDSGFTAITLPHTVTPLSWADWDHRSWENVWIYRRHFEWVPEPGTRVFADFDGVMVNATVVLNGLTVATHQGGYLPFSAELTGTLVPGGNVLAVIVDARWLPVPPAGAPGGARRVDYLQPGGIYRDVRLRTVPTVFVADAFAKPMNVLSDSPAIAVQVTVDAPAGPGGPAGPTRLTAELLTADRLLASASTVLPGPAGGTSVAELSLTGLGGVALWSPENPKLYTVRVTLSSRPLAAHTMAVRTGFRDAVFRRDGFYLNGNRYQIFGLNRHQHYPYLGMAGPARLQRRDAEILKFDLNCNMVRCSHYPQSPHFLDACDELGLMVWQEPPGWAYLGGAAWQDIAVQNVRDMVIRDRSRPCVIVWATRLNETPGRPRLYARTRRAAHELDGTRQTTGAMNRHSTVRWAQDVFAYDDYHRSRGAPKLRPPLRNLPYLVSEAIGALDGSPTYRWTDGSAVLGSQALRHAQVHSIAGRDPRYAGLLGWCGIDYPSINGGPRIWRALKTPGVLDVFRVPKPGAACYRSQADPRVRPVIFPAFYWDFGPGSRSGPGASALIGTNCDRLEIYVGGRHFATGFPDVARFGGLTHPPVLVDLTVDGSGLPGLRIDGYLGDRLAVSVPMSADRSRDRLALTADHDSITADGTDTTRITFRALDAYGNQCPHRTGEVSLALAGPGMLVAANPFPFGEYGGVGGGFVRSLPGQPGPVTVTARHPVLGEDTASIMVRPPASPASDVPGPAGAGQPVPGVS